MSPNQRTPRTAYRQILGTQHVRMATSTPCRKGHHLSARAVRCSLACVHLAPPMLAVSMLLVAPDIHSLHRFRIRPRRFDAPNAVPHADPPPAPPPPPHADPPPPREQTQGCRHCGCPANAQQRTAKLLLAGLHNRPRQAKAGKAGTHPF